MSNFRKTIWMASGFILGNFVFAFLSDFDWDKAFERAFFEATMYGATLFSLWLNREK